MTDAKHNQHLIKKICEVQGITRAELARILADIPLGDIGGCLGDYRTINRKTLYDYATGRRRPDRLMTAALSVVERLIYGSA